ncbi:MAG: hypothetical protein IH971_03295 [Candidatus Marinimicrobia bacterium]|nr:hypothetical protein [Candidatus Neomarinimicrobiota bacterium]
MLIFGRGELIQVMTGNEGACSLVVAAGRLNEPIAQQGPLVLNTEEQLRPACVDDWSGTLDQYFDKCVMEFLHSELSPTHGLRVQTLGALKRRRRTTNDSECRHE